MMTTKTLFKTSILLIAALSVASCGRIGGFKSTPKGTAAADYEEQLQEDGTPRTSIWDAIKQRDDGRKIGVNRYLWNASLEVLDFLPVESVDPFTGVIVTGYGTPPGGGRSYRATVFIKDPALDARSLNVSLQTRGGKPVAAGTQRAVEDAILTRARQLRVADGRL